MQKLFDKIKGNPKGYFSLMDIRKIAGLEEQTLKVVLSRLVKGGKIKKIGQKFYAIDLQKVDWEKFAVEVYAPSYLSFEYVLARRGILSQQIQHLILATENRTKIIETPEADIIYHHLNSKVFYGYTKEADILIAEPEKAFLDLAYLSLNGYAKFDPEEMNLNLLDKNKLKVYLCKFKSKKLSIFLAKNPMTAKLIR
jgi:predicted transcriptional regulator of viral defense system